MGAAFAPSLAFQGSVFGQAVQLSLAVAVAQVAVAALAFGRTPGAWVAAMGLLVLHVLALLAAGFVLLIFVALPATGRGPLPGHPFSPVGLIAILAGGVAFSVLYVIAFRSALGLRARSASGAVGLTARRAGRWRRRPDSNR